MDHFKAGSMWRKHKQRLHLLLLVVFTTCGANASDTAQAVPWQKDWSPALFTKAAAENRFILLNLEAVWCHWCHVMDAKTYTDPSVIELIKAHYVPVKIDHDARPDLANRYRDYGWPATIVLHPDGREIVMRAGYIAPKNMVALLTAIVADPSPEAAARLNIPLQISGASALSTELRDVLLARHEQAYDPEYGSLQLMQKFIDRDSVEYSLQQAVQGNQREQQRALHTLEMGMKLLDPVWGGFYQYSTYGDWDHPHFEKIMRVQASYLRIYALAYAAFAKEEYKTVISEVRRYIDAFLVDESGGFYVSQDADVVPGQHSPEYYQLDNQARRAVGIPRVDTHIYADANGMMAEALTLVYQATGDASALAQAQKSVLWIQHNHAAQGKYKGGYRHAAGDNSSFYLADNLHMARAYLQLHQATADKQWLVLAQQTANFIDTHFRYAGGGFASGSKSDTPVQPVPLIDENISLVRFANLLHHYTGEVRYTRMAEYGMQYLTAPQVATSRLTEAGLLLAGGELAQDPSHFTVVGKKSSAAGKQLYELMLAQPSWYKRIEWWDRSEGSLNNADVAYPKLNKIAAFVCTESRCSVPLYDTASFKRLVALFVAE